MAATAGRLMLRLVTSRHPDVWHSDRECHTLRHVDPAHITETDEDEAERMGLEHCAVCSGEHEPSSGCSMCPFCGEEVPLLPNHLPCPESR